MNYKYMAYTAFILYSMNVEKRSESYIGDFDRGMIRYFEDEVFNFDVQPVSTYSPEQPIEEMVNVIEGI